MQLHCLSSTLSARAAHPCRPEGGLGPHGSFSRQLCLKHSSLEPVLRKWHLLNSFYSAHSPGVKRHHPSAQQLGKEFTRSLGALLSRASEGEEGFLGQGSASVCAGLCNADRNPKRLAQGRHTAQYTVAILTPLTWMDTHLKERPSMCKRGLCDETPCGGLTHRLPGQREGTVAATSPLSHTKRCRGATAPLIKSMQMFQTFCTSYLTPG